MVQTALINAYFDRVSSLKYWRYNTIQLGDET